MTTATLDAPRGNELALAIRLMDLHVEVDLIDVADNVRTVADPAADAELLASVRESGVLEPVGVTLAASGRYLLRYGHRRLEASKAAGLPTIPVVVLADVPGDRVFQQLVENLHRADLSVLDVAKAIQRTLAETPKLTQAKLAEKLGWAPSTLSNTLGVLKAPEEVQQLVAAGKLERAHVVALKGLPAAEQIKKARDAAEQGWSAHVLEEQAKWARERQKELDQQIAKTEEACKVGLALLAKEGTEKTTTLLVRVPWNLDRPKVRAAIAAAGYTLAAEGTYGNELHPGCDCTVMVLDLTAEKRPTLSPGCVSDAHREAAWALENAARLEADAKQRTERDLMVQATTAALVEHPVHPPLARLILRTLESYSGKTWSEYSKLSDREIAAAIAGRLFQPYDQGKKLPHDRVLRELRGDAVEPMTDEVAP